MFVPDDHSMLSLELVIIFVLGKQSKVVNTQGTYICHETLKIAKLLSKMMSALIQIPKLSKTGYWLFSDTMRGSNAEDTFLVPQTQPCEVSS